MRQKAHPSRLPARAGIGARAFVMVGALALTSCPHQGTQGKLPRFRRIVPEVVLRTVVRSLLGLPKKRSVVAGIPELPLSHVDLNESQILPPGHRPSHARPQAQSVAEPPHLVKPAGAEPAQVPGHQDGAVAKSEPAEPPSVDGAPAIPSGRAPVDGLTHLPEREPPPTDNPLLYAIGRESWVFAEPRFDAKKLGYLRFGSDVRRSATAVSRRSCAGGWYAIAPSGYVCANGRTSTADPEHPLVKVQIERPDRAAALPYSYTLSRRGIPRFFGFAPSESERPSRSFGKRLIASLGNPRVATLPDWLRSARSIFGYERPKDSAAIGNGLAGSGIALLGFYADAGTLYGITPDLELVTTDALEAAKPSTFSGRELLAGESLPVAFAWSSSAWIYGGDVAKGAMRPLRSLTRREAILLTGERVTAQGQQWWKTKDGGWLNSAAARVIEARSDWPEWATGDAAWVDVSIQQQALVAYAGRRAVYVTLVSTGVDGLQDPVTTKSTKTGVFRVVSKHLTATMNGDGPDDAYEMREVPWVQYFSEGYALHGAYWHDGFGQPRSHGCVNLSPTDARWLFHFTNPGLPQSWHGAIPTEKSAVVFVHA